ncbi:MAG: hypothetical protein ACKN9T_02310 [Candidatus Methylumidiphilus sp.]
MTANGNDDPGLGGGDILFSTPDELRRLTVALAGQARRHLDIVSRALMPSVYADPEFIAVAKRLALSKRGQIRIIVLNPEALIAQDGHRLVELAMRVSSHMQIRRPGPDHLDFNEALLLADRLGIIHCKLSDRYDGVANFRAPQRAAELAERFAALWENAALIPHFRRLML